jgi:hypothetical protein
MREGHDDDCRLVGVVTFSGTGTAADDWGGNATESVPHSATGHERRLDEAEEQAF